MRWNMRVFGQRPKLSKHLLAAEQLDVDAVLKRGCAVPLIYIYIYMPYIYHVPIMCYILKYLLADAVLNGYY